MDNKYKYTYERTANYCYENSDVLINLLNITDDKDLYEAERELVMYRIAELIDNPIKGEFNFQHLKSIHKFLFQDIYRWSGDIRNCNIAKQDLFCLVEHIDSFAKDIFNKLKSERYFIDYNYEDKIEKLVELFADINALHPFREGNGRTQRTFIEMLAKINGIDLDLTNIAKKDMIVASHESISGNYEKLIHLFNSNNISISDTERKKYIDMYCTDNMKKTIFNKKD